MTRVGPAHLMITIKLLPEMCVVVVFYEHHCFFGGMRIESIN